MIFYIFLHFIWDCTEVHITDKSHHGMKIKKNKKNKNIYIDPYMPEDSLIWQMCSRTRMAETWIKNIYKYLCFYPSLAPAYKSVLVLKCVVFVTIYSFKGISRLCM